MIFKQRRLLSTNSFELGEKGVKVITRSPGSYKEYFTSFDDIGNEVAIEKKSSRGWLYFSLFLFGISGMHLISKLTGSKFDQESFAGFIYFGLVAFCIYLFRTSYRLYLIGGNVDLEFFRNKPNIQEVDRFVEKLKETRKSFLKNKYAKVEMHLPVENQLYMFNKLKDEDVISEEEYEHLKKQALRSETAAANPVGFTQDSNAV